MASDKKIIVKSKNGSQNVKASRIATRNAVLEQDKFAWELISQFPCSKIHKIFKEKHQKNGKIKKVVDHSYDYAMQIGTTISERIIRIGLYDGIEKIEQVTKEMIQEVAKDYLSSPFSVQLQLCREPSRMSLDEEVQIETLKTYIESAIVEKLNNGSLILTGGGS